LQIHVDARHLGEFRTEFLDDLVRIQFALGARLQTHEDAAVVSAAAANERHETINVQVGGDDFCQGHLVLAQCLEGYALHGLRAAANLAGVVVGEKTLGDHDKQGRVATSTASDTLSVASRWRMTACKLRS